MTVTGMRIMPANTRAEAPVKRFCAEESFGRTLLLPPGPRIGAAIDLALLLATSWRKVFRLVKYSAEPKPVRSADGTVPRHNEAIGRGPDNIDRSTGNREEERDCWTRVLRRSAGWRRTAEETPLARPATK